MDPANNPDVIAPNLKRRLSGVTATVVRLIPIQARMMNVVATGPGLPDGVPHLALWRIFVLPRDRWRVWHARRNSEMVLGLLLRGVFRRRLKLLFTSAAQRDHKAFTKWLISRMDAVVATSAKAASYLKRPSTVVMHGVDTDVFTPADKGAVRASLGLPEGVIMGCFGRIRAQKGVDLLVGAALDLLPSRPGVSVIFTGLVTPDNAAFHADLAARITAAGLSDRVRFLGELPWDQVVRHYQALDLFCAPARWEGFGLTPLEAMACGVPVVAADVGAFDQLIVPEAGTIVPPADQAALTEALRGWIDDPLQLAEGGNAARAHVLARHRIEGEAEALCAVYRQLLA
ncbi:MAG: glycosyltransferase family 4 protein [Paracoccaceae bacterium]